MQLGFRSVFGGLTAGAAVLALAASVPACRPECPDGPPPVEIPEFMFGLSQVRGDTIAHRAGRRRRVPAAHALVARRRADRDAQGPHRRRRAERPGRHLRRGPRRATGRASTRASTRSTPRASCPCRSSATATRRPSRSSAASPPRPTSSAARSTSRASTASRAPSSSATTATAIDDAPSGLRIPFWQTENELNQAFFTAIFGWRHPALFGAFGSAWTDWAFVTDILETLRLAVKDADPTALTTMNFHTDVHPGLNHYFDNPGWQEAVVQWRDLMDVISFDAYPNYYRSSPPDGWAVAGAHSRCAAWPAASR